eukprot:TRINITY_DN8383_c1_g1_i2.p1 TRINITY_DN8383_c1_g1~~TRINITY_DN8383_c1_g1_i2.p1  ORF type:complete len:211 (+),score=28.33 TRINITY_DN8383_c1_g1_i2:135-767(+)
MNGGWDLRRGDLLKYMRTSTNLLLSENDQLSELLKLAGEIQQHLAMLNESAARLKASGGGLAGLPEEDVYGFAEKMADVRDVLCSIAHTHQFYFNSQIEEFVQKHRSDCDSYHSFEQKFLDAEFRRDESVRAEWLVEQCRGNLARIEAVREQMGQIASSHAERNRMVLRNEAHLLHTVNNIHHSLSAAEAFVDRYQAAQGIEPEARTRFL